MHSVMNLELYFIDGINSTDTLYFNKKDEQDNYFLNHPSRIELVNFSFYPPHFENIISLSSDDIDFNSKINYLRLAYNDKYYYYFITDIQYRSEDVIDIYITMDVIQTYLFNIHFNYADVERRYIDRWNSSFINRNYIRENFSNNDFILKNYKAVDDLCFIDVVSTKTIFNVSGVNNDTINTFEKINTFSNFNLYGKKVFSDGMVHYYIPFSKTKDIFIQGNGQFMHYASDGRLTLDYIWNYERVKLSPTDIMNLVYLFAEHPSVVSINFIPFNFLDNSTINFTSTDTYYNINIPTNSNISITNVITNPGDNALSLRYTLCLGFKTLVGGVSSPYELWLQSFEYKLNENVKILQNTSRQANYNVSYLPQLLDSNYRKIEYGERISRNVFPLEEINSLDRFFIRCNYLLSSGERAYKLICDTRYNDRYGEDPYLSTFVVSSKENFTLKNDAWKTYLAQNKATLTTGLAYKYLQGAFYGGSQILKGASQGSVISGLSRGIITALNPYIEYKVNKENLEYKPDTITQGNNVSDSYMINSNDIVFRDFIVRDYEKIGEIYTKIGFKVSEHYSNENIIETLNTRLYFNYIKCGDLSISLNIMNDSKTIENISERFRNGLRFWNIKECEIDNLAVGDLFKYDNVEKILLN